MLRVWTLKTRGNFNCYVYRDVGKRLFSGNRNKHGDISRRKEKDTNNNNNVEASPSTLDADILNHHNNHNNHNHNNNNNHNHNNNHVDPKVFPPINSAISMLNGNKNKKKQNIGKLNLDHKTTHNKDLFKPIESLSTNINVNSNKLQEINQLDLKNQMGESKDTNYNINNPNHIPKKENSSIVKKNHNNIKQEKLSIKSNNDILAFNDTKPDNWGKEYFVIFNLNANTLPKAQELNNLLEDKKMDSNIALNYLKSLVIKNNNIFIPPKLVYQMTEIVLNENKGDELTIPQWEIIFTHIFLDTPVSKKLSSEKSKLLLKRVETLILGLSQTNVLISLKMYGILLYASRSSWDLVDILHNRISQTNLLDIPRKSILENDPVLKSNILFYSNMYFATVYYQYRPITRDIDQPLKFFNLLRDNGLYDLNLLIILIRVFSSNVFGRTFSKGINIIDEQARGLIFSRSQKTLNRQVLSSTLLPELLFAWDRLGAYKAVERLFDTILKKGVNPDIKMYRAYFRSLIMKHRTQQVLYISRRLPLYQLLQDSVCVKALIVAYVDNKLYNQLWNLSRAILKYLDSIYSINDRRKIVTALRSSDNYTNYSILNTLIHAYQQLNRPALCYILYKNLRKFKNRHFEIFYPDYRLKLDYNKDNINSNDIHNNIDNINQFNTIDNNNTNNNSTTIKEISIDDNGTKKAMFIESNIIQEMMNSDKLQNNINNEDNEDKEIEDINNMIKSSNLSEILKIKEEKRLNNNYNTNKELNIIDYKNELDPELKLNHNHNKSNLKNNSILDNYDIDDNDITNDQINDVNDNINEDIVIVDEINDTDLDNILLSTENNDNNNNNDNDIEPRELILNDTTTIIKDVEPILSNNILVKKQDINLVNQKATDDVNRLLGDSLGFKNILRYKKEMEKFKIDSEQLLDKSNLKLLSNENDKGTKNQFINLDENDDNEIDHNKVIEEKEKEKDEDEEDEEFDYDKWNNYKSINDELKEIDKNVMNEVRDLRIETYIARRIDQISLTLVHKQALEMFNNKNNKVNIKCIKVNIEHLENNMYLPFELSMGKNISMIDIDDKEIIKNQDKYIEIIDTGERLFNDELNDTLNNNDKNDMDEELDDDDDDNYNIQKDDTKNNDHKIIDSSSTDNNQSSKSETMLLLNKAKEIAKIAETIKYNSDFETEIKRLVRNFNQPIEKNIIFTNSKSIKSSHPSQKTLGYLIKSITMAGDLHETKMVYKSEALEGERLKRYLFNELKRKCISRWKHRIMAQKVYQHTIKRFEDENKLTLKMCEILLGLQLVVLEAAKLEYTPITYIYGECGPLKVVYGSIRGGFNQYKAALENGTIVKSNKFKPITDEEFNKTMEELYEMERIEVNKIANELFPNHKIRFIRYYFNREREY